MKVLLRDNRMRPVLQTPSKGSVGDRCIESEVGETDIPTILQKYAGNLAEMMAWRGNLEYGVQPPENLEDALRAVDNVTDLYKKSGTELSFRDWLVDSLKPKTEPIKPDVVDNKEVVPNETLESKEVRE